MYVYRIEIQYPDKQLGAHKMPGKHRVIPLATKQRLGCVLAYQNELPVEDRAILNISRAKIGEWETL